MCCTFKADNDIEVDINKLRDMVVLKRNDVGDATHTDPNEKESLYFRLFGDWWNLFTGGKWQQFCHAESPRCAKLKLIEKKEMKEYLVKSQDGKWSLETDLVGDPADNVIEVPNGANSATYGTHGDINFFFDFDFPEGRFKSGVVIWQRNPEPKQAEFLVKTNGGYVLQVLDESAGGADVVRIPDGAVKAYLNNSKTINFVNADDDYMNSVTDGKWVDTHRGKHDLCGHILVWKRETLNDQVASAEEFKQPEDLPFVDSKIDIDVENLPEFKPFNSGPVEHDSTAFTNLGIEYPIKNEIKTDFPLNRGDVNYRVAKAFNEIRGTDLTEDDLDFIRKLIDLTISHYTDRF